jgi:DNA-binding NtrC family response regulator
MRVLILDDEANMRKILGAMLRAEGYDTSEASNISDAKKAMRSEFPILS